MTSILFISLMNGAAWGGSEELWYTSALYAAEKGCKIGCVIYYWPEKEDKILQLTKAGCKIFWLPNKGRSKKNLLQKIQYKFTKTKIKKYLHALPIKEYDMVVINQGGFEIYTSWLKDFYQKLGKYALLFHNYDVNEILNAAKIKRLQNWMKGAAINLFAAKRIQDVLEQKLNMIIPNAELLFNPITFERPVEITKFPPLQNGQYIFVMLASLDVDRKAQDNLIKALSSFKWKERNWVLHLYGKGEDKDFLQSLIEENNLSEKIFLKGHTQNVETVLANAHLVLQITHRDAMPLTVVEAMAVGRALVVSDIGDMPQWVNHNVNGWVSSNATQQEIDTILEIAWNKKEQWKEMGEKSFEIFCRKFPASPEECFLQQLSISG